MWQASDVSVYGAKSSDTNFNVHFYSMASQTYQSPTTNPSPSVKGQKKAPNVHQKVVHHYANGINPSACFVCVFKLYNSLCIQLSWTSLFIFSLLKSGPIMHAGSDELVLQWDMGHLTETIARLCEQAKICGYCTNYLLRATTATASNGNNGSFISQWVRSYEYTSEMHGNLWHAECQTLGPTPRTMSTPSLTGYVCIFNCKCSKLVSAHAKT